VAEIVDPRVHRLGYGVASRTARGLDSLRDPQ
jgi:hypothetical protein